MKAFSKCSFLCLFPKNICPCPDKLSANFSFLNTTAAKKEEKTGAGTPVPVLKPL